MPRCRISIGNSEWDFPRTDYMEKMRDLMSPPSRLLRISADAHVDEPHDLWYARLHEDHRDRAPGAAAPPRYVGVLERHPHLHVVMVEGTARWVAWSMATLDEYYLAHQNSTDADPTDVLARGGKLRMSPR